MKVYWPVCLLAVSAAVGVTSRTITVENDPDDPLPEFMYFPDGDGEIRRARMYGTAEYVEPVISDLVFKLYTRAHPREGETITYGDARSLQRSAFDPDLPTYIITHGFLSSITSSTIQDIKNMYIGFKIGNVIAVDWSSIASSINYFIVQRKTMPVGGFVAQFIAFLIRDGGASVDEMHLTGHSLGAHVMGIAGKNIHRIVRARLSRITGLDPAGPLFKMSNPSTRLDKEDAEFVDVIHTCSGLLGFSGSIGDVDFRPNGGNTPQPGCTIFDYVKAGACSHSRAWEFFAESINSFGFSSLPCPSYDAFLRGDCNDLLKAPMGQPAPTNVVGEYFLNTAATSPYALG